MVVAVYGTECDFWLIAKGYESVKHGCPIRLYASGKCADLEIVTDVFFELSVYIFRSIFAQPV